jgi:coenzyme F420-reducing hydrogenase alpha subunit
MSEERTYRVDLMTRVEGEGRFVLRMRDGEVIDAELAIFEAPRFFEAFLRGRSVFEVPDITARICGICPIAYQMSSARALEAALGLVTTREIERLRRLIYCGEWIESHALHVYMLHAPDFLGYESAIEMAKDHKALVEKGLRLKKAGNRLIEVLGGRPSHPVSPRVGGLSRAPAKSALLALRDELARGLEESLETVRWTASLPIPELDVDYVFAATDAGDAYPIEGGDAILLDRHVRRGGRERVPVEQWDGVMTELHVARSNALQATLPDGTPYLCGPQSRLYHHAEKLHPRARAAMAEVGLPREVRNPYRSIVVRAVELVHAFAEALDLIDAYEVPERSYVEGPLRAGVGCGVSEAPRGLLWHRYEIADDGTVVSARIVPPTSQNQARIEADLRALGPHLVAMEHGAATRRAEQLIRSYDPCISCATHFLDLRIEDGEPST